MTPGVPTGGGSGAVPGRPDDASGGSVDSGTRGASSASSTSGVPGVPDGPGALGDPGDPGEQFIVSGPGAILGPLAESLARDPAARVIDVVEGGGSGPERLVVVLPSDRAAALAAALGSALTIEHDVPLHPLDGAAPGQLPPTD